MKRLRTFATMVAVAALAGGVDAQPPKHVRIAYLAPGPNDFGPKGLPLFQPPYSRITAIDLKRGELLWQVANGDGLREKINQFEKECALPE